MAKPKGEMLSMMIKLAVEGHHGQFDQGGQPYILHPLKVMHYLASDDEELNCIAVGHDLVEDNKKITYAYLREMGSSERVIEGIRCLTKVPGETPEEYLAKVCSNIDSMQVKLCDLRHNSDIRRLKDARNKDFERTIKYQQMYTTIQAALRAMLIKGSQACPA